MISKLQKRLDFSDKELERIEKEKADVVFDKKIAITVAISVLFTMILSFIYNDVFVLIVGLTISALLIILGIYLYNKEKNEYSDAIKEIIISGLFKESFSNVVYQPKKGFDQQFIEATGLYPKGNRFYSNDFLSANYKGVGFMQSDILSQQVTSNGKTTTTTTLFKGRWFVCDFIKDFDGYHQIRLNNFFKNRKPFKWFDHLEEFDFEDQSFNEMFTAYTTDQHEAYYLINPAYMQRLENFVNYVSSEVVFGFIDNKLHVAIFNNEDAFEVKSLNINENFVKRIDFEISLIKRIIDDLDLQLDIFK